jgi:hypothetical protein
LPAEATHTARNPWAVYLLLLCVVSGILALIATASGHPTEPPAVVKTVPEWARLTWYGLLIAGSSLALLGVWWPHQRIVDLVTGLLWERRGSFGLVLGAAPYGLALVCLDGAISKVTGAFTLGFAVAGAWRVRNIGRDLGRIEALLRASP